MWISGDGGKVTFLDAHDPAGVGGANQSVSESSDLRISAVCIKDRR